MIDLVAAVLFANNIGDAFKWARSRLGLAQGSGPAPKPLPPPPEADPAEAEREEAATREAATGIFLAARDNLRDTPAGLYLAGRGIDLAALGRQTRSLRFHPELYNRESGRRWPAMVAAVTGPGGDMIAIHRTWLAPAAGGAWRKAPLAAVKMSLGRLSGGSIRLWRGASGRSLAKAGPGESVAIGEGIETALSVAVACPELRILASVSLSNMANVALPPAIGTVILLKDEDGENPATAKALARAIDRFRSEGRTVKIARPPVGKDFNDTLTAETVVGR